VEQGPDRQDAESFAKVDIERSLVERFGRMVALHPDRVALRDTRGTYSYADLACLVAAVAGAVLASGSDPACPVVLLLDHGVDTVVAMLGVLAAGRAFVPLDPAHPTGTIQHALGDCGAGLVLASGSALRIAQALDTTAEIADLDHLKSSAGRETLADLAGRSTADSLACVLYTSGSTGKPKGTLHTHRTVGHLVWSNSKNYALTADDRLALAFSTSYAASLSEIFGAVLHGACLSMVNAKQLGIGELAAWVRRERITTLKLPVGLFRTFLRSLEPGDSFPDVRLVQLGGEALFRKDVDRFREHFRQDCPLVNRLVSTESLSITRFPVDRTVELGQGVVPVGYADDDTEVAILDDHGQPVPAGDIGQIAVRSRYLSPGYWRQPALNAATFVPGPAGDPRVTLLTGDLGRLRPDGCLEHFGRSDQRVKVRGYRVELPAVEAALNALDDVKEAAAAAHAGRDGESTRLVGYLVPVAGRELSVATLRAALASHLPDFMIPTTFIVLHKLPTTATGKVDRRKLPAPGSARALLDGVRVSPRTALERQIAEIWAEVLGLSEVGINDNFFDLGGDSLLLLRVHARMCTALGIELPVVSLFGHPTVVSLASHLAAAGKPRQAPARGDLQSGKIPDRSIAIIGMAGIFPGARDVDEFWGNLRAGVESVRTLTDEELRRAGVAERWLDDPAYVKTVPEPVEFKRFDADFFGLQSREASRLDPQHRLLLEVSWHALEHAGLAPEKCAGRIGVFAGAAQSAYLHQHLLPHLGATASSIDLALRLATDPEFLATRIAYKLNLRGPAVNVSTACSTALVAVHFACRSLLDDECDVALAGSASVESPEPSGYRFQAGWITSPDGHCRPFEAKAQGTVLGSGAGVVVLKRLDRALVDGNTILAVIRGSAINNDGAAKVGFAAPSEAGQSGVIAAAHRAAGVSADTIDYVEAHGTGTVLGDPIEIAALTQAFRLSSERAGTCAVGSVKSNVGHLSRAAGIAGLIKTVLALHHREIPPSLNCEQPNPAIDWAGSPFFVNTALASWKKPVDRPRRAGVSSFGVGGTNAHLVLEEAPPTPPVQARESWQILPLSARSEVALAEATAALASHLADHADVEMADVAFTLQVGRHDFAERRVVVCRDRSHAIEQLAARADEAKGRDRAPASPPSIVFVFPDRGVEHVGMAAGIYESTASFRADIDHCAEVLAPELGLDIRQLLFPAPRDVTPPPAPLGQPRFDQPALFAIEWALARLFMRWGIRPDAMIGHGIGEHTAACLAGVVKVEPALRWMARRGNLMQSLSGDERLTARLTAEAARFEHGQIEIPYVSGLTGAWVTPEDAKSPEYFTRLLRDPAHFSDGLRTLAASPDAVFVEVGPGQSRGVPGRGYRELEGRSWIASSRSAGEDRDDRELLLRALGELWLRGARIDWEAVHAGELRRRMPLPGYPFQRSEYWVSRG